MSPGKGDGRKESFECPGCGEDAFYTTQGAIYIYEGTAHIYTLCSQCARLRGRQRQAMLERVELVFATKGARA